DYEKLAIFGDIRGRRGAELKVLSAIETKSPGYLGKIKHEVIDRDKGKDPEGTWSTDTMTFQDDELSYALGKQGGTRKKLERASGCIVQYVGHTCLFSGTRAERRRAKDYMKWLFAQLEGPVYVDGWEDRDDCCVVHVPSDCIGYITGSRRATLGRMEEEWGTLMFFMTKDGDKGGRAGQAEKLIICGNERGRRGAELKCMNEIEKKAPGHFSRGLREKFSDSRGFDTDRMAIKEDELSYVIGKEAATQKKIEKAAGCILQFVGRYAFMAGIGKERRRCKEYIGWLLQQLKGAVTIPDVTDREDCTEMHIPANCKGWVTGNRGSELRRMEHETSTYMFMALDGRGDERLCIFSHEAGSKVANTGRMAAERLVNELVQEKLRGDEDDPDEVGDGDDDDDDDDDDDGGDGGDDNDDDDEDEVGSLVGTILTYDKLEQDLHAKGSGSIVVLVGGPQEADVAAQLIAGVGRHAAWILYRDKTAPLMVPLVAGSRVLPQHVACQAVPFYGESLWRLAATQPRKFLQEWTKQALPGQFRGVVKDSWEFAEGQRTGDKVVTGLIRIDTDVIVPLLASSGKIGVFMEPVARHPAYPAGQRPAYGLVLGGKQIGLRRAPGTDHQPKTLWQIIGTPVHWSDSFLHDLILSQTPAVSAEILRRQVCGKRCTWWVKATVAGPEDAHCLAVTEGGIELNAWIQHLGKPIPQQGAFTLYRSPFDRVDKPRAITIDGEPDAEDLDGNDGDAARPVPAAKRVATNFTARVVPEGAEVYQVPGDGACFFHAVSKALTVLYNRETSAAQACAETVAHLRRYQEAYVPYWDHVDDRQQGVQNFVDYLERMACADAWAGPLELQACSKTLKICLLVLPEDASRVPCCFGNPSHPPVALFHTRNHYDLLLPSEGTGYPGVILGIAKEAPDNSIPRAGSSIASSAPTGYGDCAVRLDAQAPEAALAPVVVDAVPHVAVPATPDQLEDEPDVPPPPTPPRLVSSIVARDAPEGRQVLVPVAAGAGAVLVAMGHMLRHAVRDQCVCEASVNLPMACMRQHEALVLAWPEPHRGGYTYALRFICRLCCAHATSRFNLLSRSCGPVVRGAARLRRHLQTACDSPDVVAKRTAEFALHVLGDALPAAPLAPPPPPTVTSLADMCADGLQYPAVPLGLANRTAASSSGLAGTESGAFLSLRCTLNVATLVGRVATVLALATTLALDVLVLQAGWRCHLGDQALTNDGKPTNVLLLCAPPRLALSSTLGPVTEEVWSEALLVDPPTGCATARRSIVAERRLRRLARRLRPLLRSRLPRSVSASAIGSKLSNRIIVACVVGFSAVPLRSRRRFPMGRCTLLTWLRLVADEHAKWSAQWTGSAAHMLEETWRWCLALGAPSDSWTPEALFPSAAALQTAVRASARRAAGIDGWRSRQAMAGHKADVRRTFHGTPIEPTLGLLQGCPFSPLLLNCICSLWVRIVREAEPRTTLAVYLDDRTVWHVGRHAVQVVCEAARAGQAFDSFFGLQLHPDKLGSVGVGPGVRAGLSAEAELVGPVKTSFVLLGVHYAFGLTALPDTATLTSEVWRRCERIALAVSSVARRRALLEELVIPLFSWSGPWTQFRKQDLMSWDRAVALLSLWSFKPPKSRSRLLLWHVLGRPRLCLEHALDFATARQEWLRCSTPGAFRLLDTTVTPRWAALQHKWGWSETVTGEWRTPLGLLRPGWDGLAVLHRVADYTFLQGLWAADPKASDRDLSLSLPTFAPARAW
ncbi:trmA, partial [Symbiodinium microadriaticum]